MPYGIDLIIRAFNQSTKPLRDVRAGIRSLSEPVSRVTAQFKTFTTSSGEYLRKFSGDSDKTFVKMKAAFSDVASAGSKLSGELGRLGLRVTALGAAGVYGFKKYSSYADDVLKVSRQIGSSAEWLQETRYAALQLADMPADQVDRMLRIMARKVHGVATGKGGAAKSALAALGIDPKELRTATGAIKPFPEQMDLIASRMARFNKDPALQLRLVEAFTNARSLAFVSYFNQGGEAIGRARQQAHEFGAVMDEAVLRRGAEAEDEFKQMASVMRMSMFSVIADLMPEIRELIRLVTTWIKDNKEGIRDALVPALRLVLQTLPPILKAFEALGGPKLLPWLIAAKLLTGVAGAAGGLAFSFLQLHLAIASVGGMGVVMASIGKPFLLIGRGIGAVLGGMGTLIGWIVRLVPAAISFASATIIAAIKAISVALFTTPVGWLILGVTALIVAGVVLYKKWKPFRDMIDSLVQRVKELVAAAAQSRLVRWFTGANAAQAPAVAPAGRAVAQPAAMLRNQVRGIPGRAQVGGRVAVDIGIPRGSTARIRQVDAEPSGFNLDVGTVMAQ